MLLCPTPNLVIVISPPPRPADPPLYKLWPGAAARLDAALITRDEVGRAARRGGRGRQAEAGTTQSSDSVLSFGD